MKRFKHHPQQEGKEEHHKPESISTDSRNANADKSLRLKPSKWSKKSKFSEECFISEPAPLKDYGNELLNAYRERTKLDSYTQEIIEELENHSFSDGTTRLTIHNRLRFHRAEYTVEITEIGSSFFRKVVLAKGKKEKLFLPNGYYRLLSYIPDSSVKWKCKITGIENHYEVASPKDWSIKADLRILKFEGDRCYCSLADFFF